MWFKHALQVHNGRGYTVKLDILPTFIFVMVPPQCAEGSKMKTDAEKRN